MNMIICENILVKVFPSVSVAMSLNQTKQNNDLQCARRSLMNEKCCINVDNASSSLNEKIKFTSSPFKTDIPQAVVFIVFWGFASHR